MNNFQVVLVSIFLACAVFAVLIFSGAIDIKTKSSDTSLQGKVTIWGTFPSSALTSSIDTIGATNKDLTINYVKKDADTYQEELVEAFANDKGPDLFIVTPDMVLRNKNFLYKVPYASYPEKAFRDTYIDGADIYLDYEGVVGFPLVVDPLVLYYNKDILSNEGIASPIQTWEELFNLNSVLTKRDNSGVISQSMIALGQYTNVNNVKDILSALLLQNGNSIVKRVTTTADIEGETKSATTYVSLLNDNTYNSTVTPIESVLKFFIEFSNPSNTAYSWNRSFSSSLDMFTAGKLTFYLGRASELFNIESVNPNLSFDVTQIPQIKGATTKRTYGEIYAMVINKKSTNLASAVGVAGTLSQGDAADNLSVSLSLPPVSKKLLATKPTDPYLYTFFNSALISRAWLDPNKIKTDSIFQKLVENVLSNNLSMGEAISKAQGELELLLK